MGRGKSADHFRAAAAGCPACPQLPWGGRTTCAGSGRRREEGCICGCGTIELLPRGDNLPRSDAANPVPVEAQVLNAEGNEIGGLLLFHKDGLIDSLEVYSYIGPPLPLPTLDEVRWTYVDR